MLNFLIISDTHGNSGRLSRLLAIHRDATAVFFLGDGLSEVRAALSASGSPPLYAVRGNCDLGMDCEEMLTVSLGVHRVLLLHGHTAGVKGGEEALLALAGSMGADIVLYGHTHVRSEGRYDVGGKPIWLFNPGSLGFPRDSAPSFGTLTVDDKGSLLFAHGSLEDAS